MHRANSDLDLDLDGDGGAPVAPAPPSFDDAELATTLKVLAWLAENPSAGDSITELGRGVARAYKRVRKQRRIDAAHAADLQLPSGDPTTSRSCYICRSAYRQIDAHYAFLCPACAATNREHRTRRADLTGRRALVTGARIKLGYQTVLKLLRDGAEVIATTRFATDAARRFGNEPDFPEWKDRLRLHQIDFRDLRGVIRFADQLNASLDGLDILINNAAQTIRRGNDFYRALHDQTCETLPTEIRCLIAPPIASHDDRGLRLVGELVGQSNLPLRSSWTLPMEDVEPVELAEVMMINTMAPFVLCSRLEPLLRRSCFADRYIVNVTSIEGQFERDYKTAEHPHTNMAKAALNMLTRTAAKRCAETGIYMNSVDPGWITHMNAVDPSAPDDEESPDSVPLDAIDGAARIYDPIIRGIAGERVAGLLLKDYQLVPW